jgi:hypothetical protein
MESIAIDKDWAPTDPRWVEDKLTGPHDRNRIWHLDGQPWWEAPVPHRWHKCRPQTYGLMDWFTLVFRCRCGAISHGGRGPWIERNQRRKS